MSASQVRSGPEIQEQEPLRDAAGESRPDEPAKDPFHPYRVPVELDEPMRVYPLDYEGDKRRKRDRREDGPLKKKTR